MKYLNEYDARDEFLLSGEGKDAGKKGLRWWRVGRRFMAGGLGSGECGAG
jgi:hypothetical protein